ncbi:response regulator [Paramagnetospirillum magneticum]|uniref:FOG: CheY-like receiver n=1 Tax=Paramagnetospirillum magneticum (strain ATCC 700264 / AMB-1) TaxID=342108 RepID=Q2W333_PARM1|nr:response regulator [Paramagnetospirillum magneticum]BAE51742.1 FOG: CheY-like receiver [Paramagnetospirillum magneticum AMB-1]
MQSLKVLIVDDSLLSIRTLSGLLGDMGHVVIQTAASGTLALEAYRDVRPDLVTMDITMPDMDGITATQNILREFPAAKVIMVTSHGQEAQVMKAVKAGAKGYVLKPIKREKLRDVISHIFK